MSVVHAKAAVFDRVRGADVLELRTVAVPAPGAGEVRSAASYFDSMRQIGKIIIVPDRPAN